MKKKLSNILSKKQNKGFTLLETFIAITVLMLALVGPLTVTQRSIKAGAIAKEQVIASFLAQDALEYVRAVREEKRPDWDSFLNYFVACLNQPCRLGTDPSSTSDAPDFCLAGAVLCDPIRANPTTGQYGYAPGYQETPFVRTVVITKSEIGQGIKQEAQVNVSVYHRKLSPDIPIAEVNYSLTNW